MTASRTPFRLERLLVALIFGQSRAMRDVLRRLGAGQAFTRKRLFNVLATTREGHDLLARVVVKLPSPVMARDPDFVSEPLNFAGQLGAVDCGGEALRTIDLDWIEAAPLPVRAAGHVGDYHMRVKMRVGAVAVLDAACGPRGDMIEAGSYDIAGDDPFAPASATRQRIVFELFQSAADCFSVCLDKAVIASDQALDTDRFGRVEGRIPTGASVVVAVRLANEYLGGGRAKPTQHGPEVFGRNLAGEAQLLGAAAEPLPYDPLLLAVIVVLGVLLFVIGLGLRSGQRTFGH